MKKILALSFFLPFTNLLRAQLHSVQKSVYPISDTDSLICYYFPVKQNMENVSSPYYKANPSLADIEKIAQDMPCDSFAVKRDGKTILTLNLKKDSTWKFLVNDRLSGNVRVIPSELSGAMTEHRTLELINNGYDKQAGQVFGKFNFNKQQIIYITTANLENAVKKTVDSILNTKQPATSAAK